MRAGKVVLVMTALALSAGAAASDAVDIVLKNGGLAVAGRNAEKPGEWKALLPLFKNAAEKKWRVCSVEMDAGANWGALRTALMAAAASGLSQVRIHWPPDAQSDIALDLPGADSGNGEVVDLQLLDGEGAVVLTENEGQKFPVNAELVKGLLAQLPTATVAIHAPDKISAGKVATVLGLLADQRAAGVAFLPLKDLATHRVVETKKPKDGEERAAGVRRIVHGVGD
jgi:hypothetical protein